MKINKDDAMVVVIDFQTSLMPVMNETKHLEEKSEIFLKSCKILDLPIIVTQQYTKGLGETIDSLKSALGEFEYIEKTSFSCLGSAEFEQTLQSSGKKDILICGIEAHICVCQTVLDFLEKGYNVFVVADCVSSRKEYEKTYALERMAKSGAIITTVESILFEMMLDAKHPCRKEISALIK